MTTNAIQSSHIYSTYFAPRGRSRIYTLGMQIAQLYLSPFDQIIGFIGEAGSGKSVLDQGHVPGIELTNDDDASTSARSRFFEQEAKRDLPRRTPTIWTSASRRLPSARAGGRRPAGCPGAASASSLSILTLIYPLLGINANLLIGVGEQIVITRPNLLALCRRSVRNRLSVASFIVPMAHSAEGICANTP